MPSSDLIFEQVKLGPMENFQYLFGSRSTGQGAIVDPGFEPGTMLDLADEAGLEVTHIVLTHSHRDHIAALGPTRERTEAQLVAHPKSPLSPDIPAEHGAPIELAGVEITPYHTPGHAPDHVAFVIDDAYLLSGDALFIGECGRVDLPGSDVEAMWHTLMEVLPALAGHLVVCPGHDYGPEPTRTLFEELDENYTLEKRDLEAFKRFMAEP